MKTYSIKVGFTGTNPRKVLYVKYYTIIEENEQRAKATLHNGLSIIEFHNFEILEVKEIEH